MTLAKMGVPEIHAWDDDLLEIRNCPTEVAYSYHDVGMPKVTAMANSVYHVMPRANFYQHEERITVQTKLSGIVVSGVDSMKSRQIIWQCVKNNIAEISFFIDGRSGGEETMILAFHPSDPEKAEIYEKYYLFGDEEAAQLACGARNIGYISLYMAYRIQRIISRFQRNLPIKFCDALDHSIEREDY